MTLRAPAQHRRASSIPECKEVYGTSDLEIVWGTWNRSRSSVMTARVTGSCLRLSEGPVSIREMLWVSSR